MLYASFLIAFIGYMESMTIGKTVARQVMVLVMVLEK
jgi:hypothetical protein